jgi:hypothetical protein
MSNYFLSGMDSRVTASVGGKGGSSDKERGLAEGRRENAVDTLASLSSALGTGGTKVVVYLTIHGIGFESG